MSYARACKDTHRTVTGYCRRAFQIHRCLARFMSEDDVVRLRLLQYHTNFVISGSVAVQFFSRESFADGDLDLYTERQHAFTIFHFLLGMGYAFRPRQMQARTLEDALTQAINEDMVPDDLHYDERSILETFSFRKRHRHRPVIQVILVQTSSIDAIMSFHSSAFIYFRAVLHTLTVAAQRSS